VKKGRQGLKRADSLVIEVKDFRVYLFARMQIAKKAPREYAEQLGISVDLLYLLLNGRRKPSASILQKVGLETCYRSVSKGGK
jgi:transcriptional regulator with XRE-family HTH domain